jgi:hypothetical protein
MKQGRIVLFLIIAATIGVFSGCSSIENSSDKESSKSSYTRSVYPFPVYNDQGEAITHPFIGGFNAPRPQFIDIDNDQDPDLFVQEKTDELMFFEHQGADTDQPLTLTSSKYKDLDIGEWFRFVDMDLDGDFDLITEQPFSYIRYYKNIGSASRPEFELAADSLRDIDGTPIFSDRQNIPNLIDIDCDNLPDLFIGSLDGTLSRYESIGLDENDIPRFKLITDRFEDIEIVKQFGTLHGANTMAFMDIDNDGDQDIFWGDFFEPSILLLENKGSCTAPDFQGEPQAFPPNNPVASSGYNAPTLTDWDANGEADLFLGVLGGAYNANETTAENFYYYRQQNNEFQLITKQFIQTIDIGDESIPATGDTDGDGDLDLLLANKIDPSNLKSSMVYHFENIGSTKAPEFRLTGTLDLPAGYHYAPALADFNNDGLADLLLGNWKGDIAYYQNSGKGFNLIDKKYLSLRRGSNVVPTLADIDNDGDLDVIAGSSGGELHLFQNNGSNNSPEFVTVEDAFDGIESRHRSAPALNDMDGDGDLDLILGTKIEGFLYFRNDGSAEAAEYVRATLPFEIATTQLGTPHFVDLDGDGIAEFLSGTRGGGLLFYSR